MLNLEELPYCSPTSALKREEYEKEKLRQNPELQFYLKVLERMRINHKDVVSVEAVKRIGRNYKKYLAT